MFCRSAYWNIRNKWSVLGEEVPPQLLSRRPKLPAKNRKLSREINDGYVIRPFQRQRYLDDASHLEVRGMYNNELNIDRARFPRTCFSLVVGTNGSIDEREFDFLVPPLMPLFFDRPAAYKDWIMKLAKLNKLRREPTWTDRNVPPKTPPDTVNMIEFPYCVPRAAGERKKVKDPLSVSA